MPRLLFILLFFASLFSRAAAPKIDAIYPAGGKIGTEIDVVFVGKCDPWPCEFWASDSGVKFVPDEKKERVGKIVLDKKTKPGPFWFRFLNAEGTSEPRLFFAGTLPEVVEDAKLEHGAVLEGQPVTEKLPLVVNGRLEKKNEADFFKMTAKKGDVLHLALDGYSLRSPIDPMLHVYDADGARLALQHDGPVNLDPRLKFPIPADGEYTIGVLAIGHPTNANVFLQGSTASVYRLHLALNEKALPAHLKPAPLPVSPQVNAPYTAPFEVVSVLEKPRTPNRVTVSAKKGDSFLAKVEAFSLGFETDPVLRIFKPDGALIRETDDVKPNRDSEYLVKISADGEYGIEVADRYGRAGENLKYRLTVGERKTDFTVTADKHSYAVKAGETVEVKLKIARINGHVVPLELVVPKIPGIDVELPKEIPNKTADVIIKLKAKADAKAFNKSIQIKLRESEGDAKLVKTIDFSLQDATARGPFLIDEISDLWLTVIPKPAPKKEEKPDDKKEKADAKAKK